MYTVYGYTCEYIRIYACIYTCKYCYQGNVLAITKAL